MVQPARTRGIYQTARRQWIANWRATLAFVIGILLSIASFYTTWDGLLAFTDPDPTTRSWTSDVLGLFVAVGIQSVMLLSAWTVGIALIRSTDPHRDLRARFRDLGGAGLWTLMFLATFAFSVFFSYHAFYTRIVRYFAFGVEQQATGDSVSDTQARGNRSAHINNLAQLHVRRSVSESLATMRNAAESQRQAYFDAFTKPADESSRVTLRNTPELAAVPAAWSAYLVRMDGIIEFGEQSIPNISDQMKKQADAELKRKLDSATTIEKQQQQTEDATKEAQTAQSEIDEADKQIEALNKEIAGLKAQINNFDTRIADASHRMECEVKGTECPNGQHTPRGQGQKYRQALQDKIAAETRKTQLEGDLRDKEGKLEKLKGGVRDSTSRKNSAKEQEKKNTIIIAAQDGAASTTPLLTETRFRDMLTRMRHDRAQLTPVEFGRVVESSRPDSRAPPSSRPAVTSTSSTGALADLKVTCEQVIANLSNEAFVDVAPEARKLSCAQDGLSGAIERVQRFNSGLVEFDKKECQTLGRKYGEANTATLIARGQDCLEVLALDGERYDRFMTQFADLSREHNASVHPFVQSMNGLTSYNDKLAYLSLGIATMVDLLVFCVGIAGGKETLRRIDRIGEELRGDEVLGLALAASRAERTTDSESTRVARLILNRLVPQDYVPDPHNAPHVRYSGYITERELQRGVADDDLVRRQIQMWISTPKSGVDLVLRVPRPEQQTARHDSGLIDDPEFEEEPARFFFLRELVIDLAENIVHWDKAHASAGSDAAAAAPASQRRPANRNVQQPAPPKTPFWDWSRSSRKYRNAQMTNGPEARPRSADQEFRVLRPDGSVAEIHAVADDDNHPPAANRSNGSAGATDDLAATENTPPYHLRTGS